MTFLKTSDGEFVPLSEIIAAWEMTPTFVELVRNGGQTHQCSYEEWAKADPLRYQFIPASPGTFLLYHGFESGEDWVSREAIIAWAIDRSGNPSAVSAAGMRSSEIVSRTCLHPDGTVQDIHGAGRLFDSYEAWLVSEARQYGAAPTLAVPGE